MTVHPSSERKGLALGLLAVVIFSITLPATRIAVLELGAAFTGFGRIAGAAVLALLALVAVRPRFPTRAERRSLLLVATGVVIGFPLLTTWALARTSASHGAIMVALLPLATAAFGAWRNAEKASPGFWACAMLGALLASGYVVVEGAGRPVPADLALLGAVLAAALGYAEGARLSRTLGGWQTIAWSLVLSLPVATIALLSVEAPSRLRDVPAGAWIAFAYVTVFSQFVGFILWYRGLALGGVARVSQVQLLQLFFTLGFSAILLGERVSGATVAFALSVIAIVSISWRMPVARALRPSQP